MSTDAPAPPAYVPGGQPSPWRRSPVRRVLLWGAVVLLIVFWIWALFFAPKESVNKIDDAWAEHAEAICVRTDAELRALEAQASPDIEVRADLVVESTDLLAAMLDDIVASPTRRARRSCRTGSPTTGRCSRTATATPNVSARERTAAHRDGGQRRPDLGAHREVHARQRDADLRPTRGSVV